MKQIVRHSRGPLVLFTAMALGGIALTLGCSGDADPERSDAASPTEEAGQHYPCIADLDAWTAAQGTATGPVDAARSPEQLIESSPMIVLGTFVQASPPPYTPDEGTTLVVKVGLFLAGADAEEVRFQRLWTPAELSASLDGQFVTGNYVAFLTGEEYGSQSDNGSRVWRHPETGEEFFEAPGLLGLGGRIVHADGLWMACDSSAAAVRVVAGNTQPPQEDLPTDTTMTMADLRQMVRASTHHPARY